MGRKRRAVAPRFRGRPRRRPRPSSSSRPAKQGVEVSPPPPTPTRARQKRESPRPTDSARRAFFSVMSVICARVRKWGFFSFPTEHQGADDEETRERQKRLKRERDSTTHSPFFWSKTEKQTPTASTLEFSSATRALDAAIEASASAKSLSYLRETTLLSGKKRLSRDRAIFLVFKRPPPRAVTGAQPFAFFI